MSKFKPGDKVLFYRNTFDGGTTSREEAWLGKVITLDYFDGNHNGEPTFTFDNSGWIVKESEIEHEHVYNSPLWKALT